MKTALEILSKLTCTLSLLAAGACSGDPETAPVTGGGAAGTSSVAAGAGGVTSAGSGGSNAVTGGGGASTGGMGGASAAGAGGTSTGGMGGASTGGMGGASAGGMGGAAPGTPTFTEVAKILQDNCGSKCHSADQQGKMDLTSTDPAALYMRLTTPLDLDLCYMQRPVQPGFASISLLATVIKGAIDRPCPLPRMPYGCETSNSCLSDADIATIDGWINAGAFQN